jgi:hypothetical protein
MILVCLFHGAGTGVGTLCHFSTVSFREFSEHVETETFQEKRILCVQLDLNKTYVTNMYGTTNIKNKVEYLRKINGLQLHLFFSFLI